MITIYSQKQFQYTLIPNDFIDYYLSELNGDFIKIYLLLLRLSSNKETTLTASNIADTLLLTEADVFRALKYLRANNLLHIIFDNDTIIGIRLLPITTPSKSDVKHESDPLIPSSFNNQDKKVVIETKPQYKMEEIANFMNEVNYKQLIYITQKYLGKMLTQQDINTLISFHDWLGLPFEVIELLIEYCATNNHRNMKYIEKAALDWSDNNIDTLAKASHRINIFNKEYYIIMKALGIGSSTPTPKQITYMDKWLNQYNLSVEIIVDACHRTLDKINKPHFNYTDSILSSWHEKNVKTSKDIENLDSLHNQTKKTFTKNKKKDDAKSKFVNYDQRTYDFDELEKKAMNKLLKETSDGGY